MQTVTLEAIHLDPAILDRAIEQHEPLEIVAHGKVAGTLVPAALEPERRSRRGFPISKGRAAFGAAEVAEIAGDTDPR